MFDCVVVFDKGIVQQFDIVDSFYECFCNEFVVNFIGDSNMLCGIVICVDGDYCELQFNDGVCIMGCNIVGVNVGVIVIGCICFECMCLVEGVFVVGNVIIGQICGFVYFGDYVCMCCVLFD